MNASPMASRAAARGSPKILVADDNAAPRSAVRGLSRALGQDVEAAHLARILWRSG